MCDSIDTPNIDHHLFVVLLNINAFTRSIAIKYWNTYNITLKSDNAYCDTVKVLQ